MTTWFNTRPCLWSIYVGLFRAFSQKIGDYQSTRRTCRIHNHPQVEGSNSGNYEEVRFWTWKYSFVCYLTSVYDNLQNIFVDTVNCPWFRQPDVFYRKVKYSLGLSLMEQCVSVLPYPQCGEGHLPNFLFVSNQLSHSKQSSGLCRSFPISHMIAQSHGTKLLLCSWLLVRQ